MTIDKLEQHKASVRQLLAAFEKGDLATIRKLTGPEMFAKVARMLENSSFSEHRLEIQELIAEGDCVVARLLTSGRQTGEFMGVPATGRRWEDNEGIGIYRFADGLIIDEWNLFNRPLQLQKLGIAMTLSA